MARKTVITELVEEEGKDGIVLIPQNKTLYADQFTDKAPNTDEERKGFQAKNMDAVFAHYLPSKEIQLEDEQGGTVNETFRFNSILDFEDEQLIEHSDYLRSEQDKIDALDKVLYQLEHNMTLRNVLKDENARNNFSAALKAMLAELETADNK